MSKYYPPNQWNWNYGAGVPGEYGDAYQRGGPQWAPPPGASFSPQGHPLQGFPQQPGWQSHGSRGSHDDRDRTYPIHPRTYERESSHTSHDSRANSSVPRTPPHQPRHSGFGSGGSGSRSGGSSGRHEKHVSGSPEYMMSGSPKQRERRSGPDRDRDWEAQRDRDTDREPDQDREYYSQRDAKLDQARQRMCFETHNYPRRLKEYLQPIFQNSKAMERAFEVFLKLEDPEHLSHSAFALLESLAATNGDTSKNKTGLEDVPPDSDDSDDEESVLEGDYMGTAEESDDSDDSDADHVSSSVGAGRRRSSSGFGNGAPKRNSGSTGQPAPSATNGSQSGNAAANGGSNLLSCPGYRPYAISRSSDGVSDRLRSYLSLTEIVAISLISMNRRPTSTPQSSKELSTKGLLTQLVRVLQPRDYRAYFRTAARVLLLPDIGMTQRFEESALEALERQLLGTSKFGPGAAATVSSGTSSMMTCVTYDSSKYGSISLYRVEMASAREGSGWPQRIVPVSAMTGVPKELLRQTARAVAPSHRTVLLAGSGDDNNSKDEDDNDEGNVDNDRDDHEDTKKKKKKHGRENSTDNRQKAGRKWVSLPAETTAIPGLGYSPNVGDSILSAGLRSALGIEGEGSTLRIAPHTVANVVNAPIPAMLAWLHTKAAYLTGMELGAIDVQRGKAGSIDEQRDESKSLVSLKALPRRIVRWKQGPTPIDHEGRNPCVVVLHPGRGDWVTTPVYWTDTKE